ncbi:MAG: UDP-glucose 4-epimerase GalE [Xanthobacteraceae bacterium]|nr:MAG: UDP-glucose 4-epimerase GalE [Xanthobacteraceae bacterium]
MKRVLVTGGAGYIGSHACKALLRAGIEPVCFDSLDRGHREAVKWGPLVTADLRDGAALDQAFATYRPEAVLHFAALTYVGESVGDPIRYYDNNVGGSLGLIAAMRRAGVDRLVFSSTCAVYGTPDRLPITEDMALNPISPYGHSKRMVEQAIVDAAQAHGLRYAILRYFNACGLDPDGELGEDHDPETHLVPRALMAAAGTLAHLELFGDDYPTPDGTCIRDYIHVSDLADAHVAALRYTGGASAALCANLGTGRGHSVREVLDTVARVTGRKVPVTLAPRRAGDPAALYADPSLARRELGFAPRHSDLDSIVRTAWPHFRRKETQA